MAGGASTAATDLLRQHTDADGVLVWLGPQLNLGQDLVGEGVAHDKAWMPSGATQVHQSPLSKQDHMTAVGEGVPVHLGGEESDLSQREYCMGMAIQFSEHYR